MTSDSNGGSAGTPLLKITGLAKHYTIHDSLWRRVRGRTPDILRAVDDVDLVIDQGEIVGLVGESGSGKTTLGRCVVRLIEPTAGEVLYRGKNILDLPHREMQAYRRRMQMVFQDPYSSLNPRMTVQQVLREVLSFHRVCPSHQIDARVKELIHTVGLPNDAGQRYPRHFSGGQRQRIGIARALAAEPEFIVADEPVSAVDVSIQAQILNLLLDLKAQLGLTLLFIAHNLGVVKYISTRVGVMYLGRIVEYASTQDLFAHPRHPYTQGLLLAAPEPDPAHHTERVALEGEPPSPLHPPPGCRFHTRCYLMTERCRSEEPVLQDLGGGHWVACHHHMKSTWPISSDVVGKAAQVRSPS